jgi:hypothetical protein
VQFLVSNLAGRNLVALVVRLDSLELDAAASSPACWGVNASDVILPLAKVKRKQAVRGNARFQFFSKTTPKDFIHRMSSVNSFPLFNIRQNHPLHTRDRPHSSAQSHYLTE